MCDTGMSGSTDHSAGRLSYLDALRIIGCFLVILNHTPGYAACLEIDTAAPGLVGLFHLFVGMIVQINVLLFFMITGTLMLGKDITYRQTGSKVLRFGSILVIFSAAASLCSTGHLDITGFIRRLFQGKVDGAGPYWYLYSHLGILVMAVFLRYIAQRLTLRDTRYLLGLRLLLTGVLPMLFVIANSLLSSNIRLSSSFDPAIILTDCIFYPLIGYGLDRLLDIKSLRGRGILLTAVLFFAAGLLECGLTLIAGTDNIFWGFDFVMAACVFLAVKYLFTVKKIPQAVHRAASAIGRLTFGIYLLDPVLGVFLKPAVHSLYPAVPSLLSVSVLYTVLSMLAGGIITYLFRLCLTALGQPRGN